MSDTTRTRPCQAPALALLSVLSTTAFPAQAAEDTHMFDLSGRTPVLTVQAVGAQVYECRQAPGSGQVWALREPIATLLEAGRTVGRHFAGPTWSFDDGEVVRGRLAATRPAPSASDIPWLMLHVTAHAGAGRLSDVTTVVRRDTQGGILAGPCPGLGELRAVPYAAAYDFDR